MAYSPYPLRAKKASNANGHNGPLLKDQLQLLSLK
jgi:hypothetical protein